MPKWRSEWLDWQPPQDSFVGFEGPPQGEAPIIQSLEGAETRPDRDSRGRIIEKAGRTVPAKPTKPLCEPIMGNAPPIEPSKPTKPAAIPSMPEGVRLVRWEPKPAPVLLTTASVVTNVGQFISQTLTQLDKALQSRQGPATNHRVRELVDPAGAMRRHRPNSRRRLCRRR